MENTNHDETFLLRWLSGQLSDEELEALRQEEGFAELQAAVEGMKKLEMPSFSEKESWEKLLEKRAALKHKQEEVMPLSEEPAVHIETPVRSLFRHKWIMGLAAAVAILLGALWWLNGRGPDYGTMIATHTGEQKKVTLPDGSTATLNAASTIGFTAEDWPENRNVYLEGEAHFRAKKGKTFRVETRQGQVRVIGTVFNVYARDKALEVKCTEGQVQVINPTGSEKALVKAGEQVAVINGKMQKRRGLDFSPKWFKGESAFQSTPLPKVFQEMERQYGVLVLSENLQGRKFSGKFVHDDLEKALVMICQPMELKYEVSGDTVRIY